MINLTTTVRPTFELAAEPPPVSLVPATGGTTLITEQQVLFSTAAVALPRVRPRGWATAIKSVSHAMSALFTASRPPAQRYQGRRYAYLENALMSREMDRL